jgi:hypothetical protein
MTGLFAAPILTNAVRSWGEMPRPSGDPHVYAMGSDPDRILLIGAGAVRGVGVTSYDLGVGGHLARKLSALTGRGAHIELLGVPGLTVPGAAKLLAELELSRFDAVVLMLGTRETVTLRSPRGWRRDIRALVERISQSSPSTLSLFVVGIPPLTSLLHFGGTLSAAVGRQIRELNAATQEACEQTGAYFVPFSPKLRGGPVSFGDTATYAAWADPIAMHMYRSLDAAIAVPHPEASDEELRQASLEAMGILDTPPTHELNALARVAKDLFGVAGASVNLIDRERQHTKASYGFDPVDLPRSESFCSVTVEVGGLLVVEDTRKDPRFANLPSVQAGIHFYAGYPVEAPNGQRIGTLCLFDSEPRTFTSADKSLLRELALRVQAELWSSPKLAVR